MKINATGGGVKGQAEAAKLGIARVLIELNPEFRPALKAAGLLKRDPRSVERKKFGKKKARRASSSLRDKNSFELRVASLELYKSIAQSSNLQLKQTHKIKSINSYNGK